MLQEWLRLKLQANCTSKIYTKHQYLPDSLIINKRKMYSKKTKNYKCKILKDNNCIFVCRDGVRIRILGNSGNDLDSGNNSGQGQKRGRVKTIALRKYLGQT